MKEANEILTDEEVKRITAAFTEACNNSLRAISPRLAASPQSLKGGQKFMRMSIGPIMETMQKLSIPFEKLSQAILMDALATLIDGLKNPSDSVPPAVHAKDLGATSFPRSTTPGLN